MTEPEPLTVVIRHLIGRNYYEASIGSVRITAQTREKVVEQVERLATNWGVEWEDNDELA